MDCDYYTDAIDYTQVKVLEEFEGEALGGARRAAWRRAREPPDRGLQEDQVLHQENVGAGKLSMPEQEMHTTAFWLHFPATFLAHFAGLHAGPRSRAASAGLGNALRTVAALLLMCDPRDLGVA